MFSVTPLGWPDSCDVGAMSWLDLVLSLIEKNGDETVATRIIKQA